MDGAAAEMERVIAECDELDDKMAGSSLRTLLGDRVILHPGVVIGSDGFGYLASSRGIRKVPQVGVVEIQDDVEIGAGSCIDRATTGRTVVQAGSKIDNLVQIDLDSSGARLARQGERRDQEQGQKPLSHQEKSPHSMYSS